MAVVGFVENQGSSFQLFKERKEHTTLFLSRSFKSFGKELRCGKERGQDMEKAPGDSLNGLKFGEKIYFEDVGGRGSSSKSLSSLAGKRGMGVAAHAGGQQKPARCQVEGCNLDLTGAKAYYCRHKVCGMHSKSPKVIVAGLEQRFCQQCSRFHLLLEFDQGKRSCRRRLAGHNERRRKPPPPVPLLSPCGQLLSFHQDNRRSQSFLMHSNQPRPPNPINQWLGFANPYPRAIFSDSTSCALSLLSTQPWSSADAAAASRANINGTSAISTSNRFDSSGPIAELNMASCYMMNSPWDFKDDESGSSSLEMGIRQVPDSSHGCFSSELGLALQSPDDFVHHEEALHWPL